MRTFLQRFYEYINSPEGFNCVEFTYDGTSYQVTEGHFISFTDKLGKVYDFSFPKNIDILLDAKVLHDGKSLREVWHHAGENDLLPEFY